MKTDTLIVVLLAIGGAYLLLGNRPGTYADRVNAAQGGTAVTQPDPFGSILGAVSSIFDAVGSIAQTTPKTN